MTLKYQFAACLLSSFLLACVAFALHADDTQANGPARLVVAVSSSPRSLNPATTTDTAGARLLQLTHPALLQWGPAYRPQGLLAHGCTQPDDRTVTCTLHPDRQFTDGTALSAPAVAAWFQKVQQNPLSPFAQLKNVTVTAENDTDLRFRLASPTLGFLGTLTEIPVANPDNPDAGGGSYRLAAHDALGNVTLEPVQPDLPTLTFTPVQDATTRLLKLKKGEVDAVYNDMAPQLVEWARRQGFTVRSTPGTSYSYLGLNMLNPQLANPLVREALASALNRAAIRHHLLGGMAEAASTLLPPGHPAAYAAPEEPYDPFAAENLLDDAGLLRGPENTRFHLTLMTSTDPFSQRVSQVLQQQLQNVGIAVTLRPTEWASFYDSVKKGNFDMVMLAWTGELPPAFYEQTFHSRQTPPAGFNRGHLSDPETDRLTERIMAATTEAELNAATVAVQKRLAHVRPYIPLYRRHQVLITAPGVKGCTIPASGAYTGLTTCRKP